MTIDFAADFREKMENKLERVAGLGNRRSIRLSYGANGSFPSFPPNTEAATTTQTRNGGLNMSAQEVAQHVPDLITLAERCEQATGPDRELDEAIADALMPAEERLFVRSKDGGAVAGRYTASLDAAMTLVPEGWDNLEVRRPCDDAVVWSVFFDLEDGRGIEGCGESHPLALCAAALRARAFIERLNQTQEIG